MKKMVVYKEDTKQIFDLLVQGYVLSMQVLKDTVDSPVYVLFLDDMYVKKGKKNEEI